MEEQGNQVVTASVSEYKGYPTITLATGLNDKYPFSFGLQKAKRIVAVIEDIKKFIDEAEAKAKVTK